MTVKDSLTGPMKKISAEIEKSQRDILRSGDALADAYSRLAGELSPAVAAQQKFQRAQLVLDEALKKGVVTQQEYNVQLDAARKKFAAAAEAVKPYGERVQALGRQLSDVGGQLSRSLTLPLAALGGASVKAFADFDGAMNQSLAIMGDVSDSLRVEMASAAREMAKETVFSAKQAAESYFFLASAGLDAESSIAALPTVARFAQAGMFDMALATDLLTDAQSALGLTIRDDAVANMQNMLRVSDVFVRANTLANATVQQFSESLTNEAGAALKSFNIDVEEGVAVLAAFADQGVKGNIAGTGLSRILRLMTSAAVENAEAYRRLNVTVFDSQGNIRNLADIISDLENALGDLSDEQRTAALESLGFQARVQGVILPLLGTSEAIRNYEKELRSATGFTEQVAGKQLEAFSKRMGLLKDRIVDVFITLGGSLAPLLSDFADRVIGPLVAKLSRLAEGFAQLPAPIRAAAAGVLTLAAAAGPVLIIGGALVSAWGAVAAAAPAALAALTRVLAVVTGPAGLIAAAAATLLAWRPVREFLIDLGRRAFAPLREWIGVALEFLGRLWGALRPARQVLSEVIGFLGKLASAVIGAARVIREDLLEVFRELFEDTRIGAWRDVLSEALETVIQLVGRASSAFLSWWRRTAEFRDLVVEFARVALKDVAEGIGEVIRFIAAYLAHVSNAIKETARLTFGFLEWVGVIDVVRAGVHVFVAGVKLMLEWMREAITRITEWVTESDGFLRVIAAINPALGLLIGKVREWASEADKNLRKPMEAGAGAAADLEKASGELTGALDDLAKGAGDTGSPIGQMSEALSEALDNINGTIAVNSALLAALEDSQEAYEILNTLIDHGVPLADALTGAYDEQAKKLLELDKATRSLIEAREAQQEIAKSLAETERQLAADLEAVIEASQGAGAEFPLFEPPEGVTDEYVKILGAVGKIRREEEERAALLAEIQRQLAAGLITQEEAARLMEQYGQAALEAASEAEAAMKRAWENIQDIASGAIAEIIKTGEISWKDLGGSLLDVIAQMLAKMLAAWLANLAVRLKAELAAAAAARAAWSGIGATGGGGGGGGWLSALGSIFGGGGGAGSSYAVVGDAASLDAALGAGGGNSSWYSAAGGALGAVAIVGVVAAFAAWASSQAAKRQAQAWFEAARIGEGLGTVMGAPWSEELQKAAQQWRDQIRSIMQRIGAEISTFPAISIDVRGSGKEFRAKIQEQVIGLFRTYEEAMQAAILAALKQVDLTGAAPELAAALHGGSITSLDQLNSVLDIFDRMDSVLDPIGQKVREFVVELQNMARELQVAGISLSAMADYAARGWQSIRDSITGVTLTAEQQFERDRKAFNAAVEAERAKAEATLATAAANQAAAQAEVEQLQILIASMQVMDQVSAQALANLTQNLIAAQRILASSAEAAAAAQAALDALPDLIGPDEFRRGGGAGSQRRSEMEQLRDLLDQMAFDRLVAGMTELEAEMAKLDREYRQQMELAHGNAELIARLTEEYARQREEATRQIQLSAVDTFTGFTGIGSDPFSQLREGFDEAVRAATEAGFGAERAARMVDRLTSSYRRQLRELSRQELVSIGDGLMGILERYYGGVEGFEAFRMKLERTRFELELANLRVRFAALKAEGALSRAVLQQIQGVFDFIESNPVDWDAFFARAAGGGGGGSAGGGAGDLARQRDEALRQLREIQARGLSPLEQAIRGVVDTFAELRQTLGWTAEVQAAYAQEIRRVLMEQLAGIRRMQEGLVFRPGSSARSRDQFRLAQSQANEAMAALLAGDLAQIDRLPELIQRVLDLNPNTQASSNTRFLEAWAQSLLEQAAQAAEDAALGIEPGGANDPFAWLRTDPTAGDDAVTRAVYYVATRQDAATNAITEQAREEAAREARRQERERAAEDRRERQDEHRAAQIVNRLGINNDLLRDIRRNTESLADDKITLAGVA